jgi:hypothetical protein
MINAMPPTNRFAQAGVTLSLAIPWITHRGGPQIETCPDPVLRVEAHHEPGLVKLRRHVADDVDLDGGAGR